MKKLMSKAVVAAVFAGSAVLVPPADAQPIHPCWLHRPETLEELWLCLCGEMANQLSPVIPPDQWECGFPDIPPEGGGS